MWGRHLGVRAENLSQYPHLVIYRSLKISHEYLVAFGKKTVKIQDGRQRIFKKINY